MSTQVQAPTLQAYIVWEIKTRNSRATVFDVAPAPRGPLAPGEGRKFALGTVPTHARGYAYMHGFTPTDAIERYKVEYADFIGR